MWRLDPDGSPTPIYSPEDNEFLNEIDDGYIGYSQPQMIKTIDNSRELWVIQPDGSVKKQYVPEEQLDEYAQEWGDNDPASPEQAYA